MIAPHDTTETNPARVVHYSGGKDSTAALALAVERYGADRVVALFNDTGWEHPVTHQYVAQITAMLGVRLEVTRPVTIPELIRRYGKFPFGRGRFCTASTKQRAAYHWWRDQGYYIAGHGESWIGIRSDESSQRGVKYGQLAPGEVYNYRELYSTAPKSLARHVTVRLPIVDWSRDDVLRYLAERDIPLNPLYAEGTNDRVGCYPCLLASRSVQSRMFATPFGQERLAIIRQLEQEIGQRYEMYATDQGSCEVCKA